MSRSSVEREEDHDADFAALPVRVQRKIDHAFDSVLGAASASDEGDGRPHKRRRLDAGISSASSVQDELAGGFVVDEPGGFIPDEPAAGGFLPDEPAAGGFLPEEPMQGGFIADDEPSMSSELEGAATDGDSGPSSNTRIPLSLIPSALQLLDLQPDDEDTLAVFRNAASGWESRGRHQRQEAGPSEQYVSRRDWRAVCAVLLEGREAEPSEHDEEEGDLTPLEEEEDSASEDEYMASDPESDLTPAESDSDEYRESSSAPTAKGNRAHSTRRKEKQHADISDEQPRAITARQQEECRRAFALFFPDVRDADLDAQRIRIKDVARVAKLLKEKISAEEIVEMLDAFSTTPDKSVGLRDFERMMLIAKLA